MPKRPLETFNTYEDGMRRRYKAHLVCATIVILASTLSCGGAGRHPERDGGVWFVQVTDPYLFLDTSKRCRCR